MTRRRVWNIIVKEWRVLLTDVSNTLIVTLLPFLIVGQLVLYIWLASNFGGESMLSNPVFQGALEKLEMAAPAVAALPAGERLLVLLLSQANLYLLLIPAMIAINSASFSIVDEKLSRSLEALLATPVRTWELLLGKALAGAAPALVFTWLSALAFLLIVAGIGWGRLVGLVLTPAWFLSLFLLTPAVAMLSFMLGVVGSSRARDARSAQNLAVVIILPVLALIGVQLTGLVWFTTLTTLALALGLVVVDLLMLRVAVRLFQRESIILKWR
ncbi:MAG: ABC transporter permease subunit [Chloroflexi bacterium]|nr:ABC transporter permease subunit [Chloroflexota bacterium]